MATATGWGALPISLSFGDSIKSLVAELNGPVAKAARNAGGNIEKEIGNAAKQAADRYEKQQWRMQKATKEKTAAEEDHRLKLLEQQRAQTALENAEKDLADAREVGGKKARDAQLRYEAAQIKVEKATIATRKASDKLDGSIDEIAKATESAEQAFKDMEKAQEDSNKESSKMGGMFDDMSGKAGKLGGALKDVVGKVGPLAAGIAGAASIGEVISLGQEAAGAIGGLNRELGLTGDEAKVMGDEVGEVLRSGVVGSAEEAAEAVGALKSNFKDLSDEDLSELADNFAGFSKTFDIDITEATQTAGQLLTNGLAGDAEEAADLMTAAMQRMPKAMRDELPELTNEYGTFFSSLGYSGEDMMGMFVNVSDQGKIAMDKLGDSLKEAGIRATDLGDSGAVEALEEIGLGAEDIQNRLLAGGDTAKEAFQEMVGAIESVEDPAERAEAAVALIGTPLEDLNKAELDGFLGALSGGADAMEGFEGSSQELSDSIANSLQGRIDSLKGTVQDLAGDAFMYVWDVVQNKVIPGFQTLRDWVQDIPGQFDKFKQVLDDNKGALIGIATVIAPLIIPLLIAMATQWTVSAAKSTVAAAKHVASWTLVRINSLKSSAVSVAALWRVGAGWISSGAQAAIGAGRMAGAWALAKAQSAGALIKSIASVGAGWVKSGARALVGAAKVAAAWVVAMGPIAWITAGIAAVVGGLTWFFTQTEVGREMWEKLTTAMAEGWDWVSEKFAEGIDWISEKWDSFTSFMGELWGTIKTTVFDAWTNTIQSIRDGWDTFTGAISGGWTWLKDTLVNVWTTVRDAVFAVFIWYINRVKANFELVTGALSTAWTWLKDILLSVWTTIRDAVFAVFEWYITRLKNTFNLVTGAINTAWTWLKDMLLAVWDKIRELVFTAFNNAVQNVQNIFDRVTGAISNAWTWLKDQLHAGWTWIKENVFDAIGRGLDTVKGWFRDGVDAIGRIWDGLKDAAKKPVKFVVDTVWNNGLLKAINAVTGFIGMDDIQPINIGFARGGILPGWSRMSDGDNRLVPMRDGEGVLVSEGLRDNTSRSMFLAANEHAKRGGSFASFINEMGSGFATGGILNLAGALSSVQESHARFVAKFFPDLFALTSASRSEPGSFHDYGAQKATDWQAQDGQYATQMPTPNSKALARAIYTNFPNSAELIHWPLDGWQNLDEGRPHDFGAGTNAGHGNHVHWATHSPLQFDGDDIILTDSGGGGSDGSFVKRIWDGIVDKISPFDKGAGGWFSEVPGAFVKSAATKLWDFVSEKVKSVFSFIGGGGGADQWSDLALVALKRMGYGEEHLPAMLQQIQIESGGNPNAVNMWDENAVRGTPSGGLLQVIEPTYRRVRNAYPDAFEGLPDDRMEPITNLTAGVGAVKMDWGGPAGRWPTKDGYAQGGIVDLPKLFDKGGVWRDGTMGVNLSGSDEVVFNNRQWQLLKQVLNTVPMLTDSQEMMVKEIGAAFLGGDVGYAELANALGSEKLAQQVTDIAFLLGEVSRDTEVMAAAAEFNEQARKSAEDYAAEQASGLLSTFGLEGLVPLAQKAGGMAWDAYVANPVDVAMTPNGVTAYARKQGVHAEVNRGGATVTIEAESDDDLIRVKQFKKLAEQVDGLEVQVKRKPKAAVRTRGGVM